MKEQPQEAQPERRRGRPRVVEPQEPVSTRLPASVYDAVVRAARARDTSVSRMVRRLVIIGLTPRE